MDRPAVFRRLALAAQSQAARLGFDFSPNSWDLTRDLIERGVDRLEGENLLGSEPHLAMAEAGISAFVARMVVEAQERGYPDLHEDTFVAAKKFFCPLWPFC